MGGEEIYGSPEHLALRATVRKFVQAELAPRAREFDEMGRAGQGDLPPHGRAGLLGIRYDPKYGGQGLDYSYHAVFLEELALCDNAGVCMGISVQTDMATPALHRFGSEELKQRFLVPAIRGEHVAAIAVTEPGAGSDVSGIRTRAVRDGDQWVINGSKMYITNAATADWLCLLAVTDPAAGYRGYTQIIVPTDTPGLQLQAARQDRQQRLRHRPPVLRRRAGAGRQHDRRSEPRLPAADDAVPGRAAGPGGHVAGLRAAPVGADARSTPAARAFGKPLAKMQVNAFKFVEMLIQINAAQALAHQCIARMARGEDIALDVSMAKVFCANMKQHVATTCMQLFGGSGYIWENPAARAFVDSRLGHHRRRRRRGDEARRGEDAQDLMDVFVSRVDTAAETFAKTRDDMRALLAELDAQLALARAGGGERSVARHRERGKLLVRERIELLLDPDSPFLELSPLAGWGTEFPVGGGLVSGIGVVSGVECVVAGNDPTVLGGAITAISASRRSSRPVEIARQNRLPYVQFVESAGGDLRRAGTRATRRRRSVGSHDTSPRRAVCSTTSPVCPASASRRVSVVFGSLDGGRRLPAGDERLQHLRPRASRRCSSADRRS